MGTQRCVICEQHLSQEDSADLGLCLQAGKAEQLPVTSCVQVDNDVEMEWLTVEYTPVAHSDLQTQTPTLNIRTKTIKFKIVSNQWLHTSSSLKRTLC